MFNFNKDQAIEASKQFCYALEVWTATFTGPHDAEYDNSLDTKNLYPLSDEIDSRLSECHFVTNVRNIFDFALTGTWNKQCLFEDSTYLESEAGEILTQLSAFDEVFKKGFINFHGQNAESLLDIDIGGENVVSILLQVLDAASARFSLITGMSISLEQLALLGNVSLKTAQNAMSLKGVNQLIPSEATYRGKTLVDHVEALRWLQAKKGYTGPVFIDQIPHYTTYQNLGQLQHHCLSLIKRANTDLGTLAKKLDWHETIEQSMNNLIRLKVTDDLTLITPQVLYQFGEACVEENLEVFVKEGSKTVASSLAEYEAKKLFA
jgi:hypothetical protein